MAIQISEAIKEIEKTWLPIAQLSLGCPAIVDIAATEEHEWGWLVCIIPIDEVLCTREYKKRRYAIERETGVSTPVGTKGLEKALGYFANQRKMQP